MNKAGRIILLVFFLALLVGCRNVKNDTVIYDALEGVTLKTGDSQLTVRVIDNKPVITELSVNGTGRNIADGSIPSRLPSEYYIQGDIPSTAEFEWKYRETKPFSSEKEKGVVITFDDPAVPAEYDLYITAHEGTAGPFEIYGYLHNKSDGNLTVAPGGYFSVSVNGDKVPVAWTFAKEGWLAEGVKKYTGDYISGTGIYTKEMTAKTMVTTKTPVTSDCNNPGDIPMTYIDYGTYGMYFAQEWTSGRLTVGSDSGNGDVSVSVYLHQTGKFETVMPAGGDLYLPRVYLGVYEGDVDDGSNVFKRWFFACKAPEALRENPDEPLTQIDIACVSNYREAVKIHGFQSLKWDYGWWDGEPISREETFFWRTNEGLLEPSKATLDTVKVRYGSKNLTVFNENLKKIGASSAVYILLRDTMLDREGVPTSVGEYGHPEWFSNRKIGPVYTSADLGNTECVAFWQKYMKDFFDSTGAVTWRSDFEPICASSDKANRHTANGTDVPYWCTVGFGELVDYLYSEFDGFRYESCSSGGLMKDFYTMTKAVVINCDDSSDYQSLHASFYDSSYCIHPAQLQLPMNLLSFTKDSANYTGTGDYVYGLRCALTGGVMIAKWGEMTAEDRSYWSYYIANVYNKKLKPLIREGDLYHILPRPDGVNWDGLEYVDADTGREIKGVVMLWKPTNTEGETKTIKLRGLKADVSYQLTFEDRPEQNRVMTGAELMETGLSVTIKDDVGSEMIWLTEAK